MKKYLHYILCVFLLVSCTNDDTISIGKGITEGEKAIFTFSANVPATPQVTTRSTMSAPGISNLYLVVFDKQGALVEVAKAEPLEGQSFGVTPKVEYKFKVTLTQTAEKRYVHFIANYFTQTILDNFSWGYEWELIPSMTVGNGQDAYWQRLELDGIYGPGTSGNAETIARMTNVPLIRNFAKITIDTQNVPSNFQLEGFVVINTLDKGSVAPYNTNKPYFANYVSYQNDEYVANDYAIITGANYENYVGYEPEEATLNNLNTTIPAPTDFNLDEKFLYERHHRNGNQVSVKEGEQTFVLIKGKFDAEETSTFYKVDLVFMQPTSIGENATLNLPYYHNVLRNFEYQIKINEVVNSGYSTPEEAARKVASNNLLGSTETRPYTNISDETARIFVEYTDKTVVYYNDATGRNQNTFTLKYKYCPDFKGNPSSTDNTLVKLLLEDPATGTTSAIKNTIISTSDDTDGWRTITITPNYDNYDKSGADVRKQTLMLYVTDNNYNLILSRDVDFTVRPALNMIVECDPNAISQEIGQNLNVKIKIPVQIDQLLFPLDFVIESEKASIYPNHNAANGAGYMPVSIGPSLVPNSNQSETTVRYVKTLTWEDYQALEITDGMKYINCPFLTNKEESASKVYVQNTYFNLGTDEFTSSNE